MPTKAEFFLDDVNMINMQWLMYNPDFTGIVRSQAFLIYLYRNGYYYSDSELWFKSLSDQEKQMAIYYMDLIRL